MGRCGLIPAYVQVGQATVGIFSDDFISGTDTSIVIAAPPNAAGAYAIRVFNCNGDLSPPAASKFPYVAPKVTGMTPKTGPPGTTVTLNGTGFGVSCASSRALVSVDSQVFNS